MKKHGFAVIVIDSGIVYNLLVFEEYREARKAFNAEVIRYGAEKEYDYGYEEIEVRGSYDPLALYVYPQCDIKLVQF